MIGEDDWVTRTVLSVLIGQGVIGTIVLIGLVAVIRRFLAVEFPASMTAINTRLDRLHTDFEKLEQEFRSYILEQTRLKERVDGLAQRMDGVSRRQDGLDDTSMRRRRVPNER